jgi:hypothetical protein
MAEALYKGQQTGGGAQSDGSAPGGSPAEGEVVDAEFAETK